MKIVMPYHYKVYKRKEAKWFTLDASKVFYNSTNVPLEMVNTEQKFGLITEQVIIELFRINGGRTGFYLANLRDREYYYCGLELIDMKATLQSLGISRPDPIAN